MQQFLIVPKQSVKQAFERFPSITERTTPKQPKLQMPKAQKISFSNQAEKILQNEDYASSVHCNSFDQDPFHFPAKILNVPSSQNNTSVVLQDLKVERKISETYQQLDTNKASTKLPRFEKKVTLSNDPQLSNMSQLQFYDISDDNLGYHHEFLLDQTQEGKSKNTRQTTQTNTTQYLSNSPKRVKRNSIMSSQFPTIQQDNQDDENLEIHTDDNVIDLQTQTLQSKNQKKRENMKKFKNHSLAIQAAFRMKKLYQVKKRKQQEGFQKYAKIKANFNFKDKLVQNKIKEWTQMSFTKVITTLHQYSKKQWDFISENQDSFTRDLAVTNLLNLFNLLLTNLEIMTRQYSMLPELAYQSFLEQYVDYRQSYNIFVSRRTYYLSQANQGITSKETAMILTECVIMNNFIPNLIMLTENKKRLDPEDSKVPFILRAIITLLQTLFMSVFRDLPSNKILNPQFNYTQYQIGKNKTGMVLVAVETTHEEFFKGTFKKQQMQQLFDRKEWYSNIELKFMQIVNNISRYRIQDF